MTKQEYNQEIKDLAEDLLSGNSFEDIQDNGLDHETIDGHEWVIYNGYHKDIIDNSDNPDAYQDIYSNEDLGRIVSENGIDELIMSQAFHAMSQDLQQELWSQNDE